MRIIAFIEEQEVVGQILEHLKLLEEPEPRPPPAVPSRQTVSTSPSMIRNPRQTPGQGRGVPAVAMPRRSLPGFRSADHAPGLSGPGACGKYAI